MPKLQRIERAVPRPTRAAARVVAAAWLPLLAGCTAPQWHAAGMQWQRNACQRIEDRAERDRCLQDAQRSYDSHRAQGAASAR